MKDKTNPKKEKQKKTPKRKPKYGMFSCVGYVYKLLWKYERKLTYVGIFTIPLTLILAALALYTPTLILRTLEQAQAFSTVTLIIAGLLLAELLFSLINHVTATNISWSEHYVLMHMEHMMMIQQRDEDFYLDYDPEVKLLDDRAHSAIENNHTAGIHFPMDFSNMVATLLKFLLFGSVISLLNPLIILLLAGGCAINYFMGVWERKRNYETRESRDRLNRKMSYLVYNLSHDLATGKDIRLYNLRDYLAELADRLLKADRKEIAKVDRRSQLVAVVSFLVVLVRDGAAYAFLILLAARGQIDAASFVLYFSAITAMSGVMSNLLGSWSRVSAGAMQMSDFRERLEVRGKHNRGKGLPLPQGPFSIEFKDVSYKYPRGEQKVLDHISFKIEAGERIALVGLNGAGKTTLTKLMCGLILPDEGEVLLDGHNLMEYNRDEMYSLFGLIPQDYKLLPISIARNVALTTDSESIDEDRLKKGLEIAGLTEKVASLPKKEQTPLNRQVNPEDGVELSGGEAQRLLLARLLYHHPRCIILDEPTAALDPIAEDRMYRKYNEIAQHSTAVFISHRLASTRFCNRIFLLDGAKFAESGTHEELMAAGGKYRELFDIQSKYYKEGAKADEAR